MENFLVKTKVAKNHSTSKNKTIIIKKNERKYLLSHSKPFTSVQATINLSKTDSRESGSQTATRRHVQGN